jgi:hypothetical protein
MLSSKGSPRIDDNACRGAIPKAVGVDLRCFNVVAVIFSGAA